MADNVTVDNPSNGDFVVATNDLGDGTQAQTVQLLASDAANADDRVPASETDGLLVNLGANNDVTNAGTFAVQVSSALPAGTNAIGKLAANSGVNIGDVRNRQTVTRSRVASASLTTASTAYTAGDQLGTMLAFTSAASANGGTGTIVSAVLLDKADVITDVRLHFFRSNVTLAADNSAFAVSDTDMQDHCGYLQMPSAIDVGGNRISTLGNIGLGYDTGAGTTLYVALETRSGHTFFGAATDLNLTLTLLLD